jgi:hypothetical protein
MLSFGDTNTDAYCLEDKDYIVILNNNKCSFGKIYNLIFLMINMVLFLNLIIAILSSTFAYYEDK